jgi:hypothetical protein
MGSTLVSSPAKPSLRSRVIRQVTLWHWVSSGICLGGMLLFTITGITLNHASAISANPVTTQQELVAPPPVVAALQSQSKDGRQPIPAALSNWLSSQFASAGDGIGEWNPEEVYVSLPRPGGDAWVTIQRQSGAAHYEKTDRGWVSYINDLHKGRHTGPSWSIYIDVLAGACLVFTATGLILLQTHAAKRPATWPTVAFSIVAPILVLLFFVHR